MVNSLRITLFSSAMALCVACSGDSDSPASDGGLADARQQTPPDAALQDARPASFNCGNGNVPDPLVLAGKVKDLIGSSAAQGVVLDVYPTGATEPVVSVTTNPDGEYTLDIPTGAVAWTGEIRATHEDYIPMHIYPSGLVEDFNDLDMPALTPEARALAGVYADVTIEDTDALVLGFIFDCNQLGVEGASITTNLESGDLLYVLPASPFIDVEQSTTSTSGIGLILNAVAGSATPGKATMSASYQDLNWEVEVDVIPGELAIAIFMPYSD